MSKLLYNVLNIFGGQMPPPGCSPANEYCYEF